MKKVLILAALFCLLTSVNQVNAQLIIKNNGRAEIGQDPFDPVSSGLDPMLYSWLDTITTLKVFGSHDITGSGAHMTFGDNIFRNQYNVAIGELGFTNTDCLWLQARYGIYVTANTSATDTVMFYDPRRSTSVNFTKDVSTSGVFIQSDERFKENVEPMQDVLPSLDRL